MGSINKSHNEADGGVLLFNGELILLYCDSVQCEIGGKESVKGRVYLTTHRLVMIVTPYRQNSPVKSLCAPFCAITKCNVEQPIFGVNYVEATVRYESDSSRSFSFKLRFSKGGAIEFSMAMNRAVVAVGRNFNPSMHPPPPYTPALGAQYYQAPPSVYAPGYNCGVRMPIQQFPDRPPIGFIYSSSAPSPYPGLSGQGHAVHPQPPYSQQPTHGGYQSPSQSSQQPGYPAQQQPGQYPQQPQSSYPQHQASANQQSGGYTGQQQTGYHQTGGYAGQQSGRYPSQQPGGYPGQQSGGYSSQQPAQSVGYQSAQSQSSSGAGYPDLSQSGFSSQPAQPCGNQGSSAWTTAPSFNPHVMSHHQRSLQQATHHHQNFFDGGQVPQPSISHYPQQNQQQPQAHHQHQHQHHHHSPVLHHSPPAASPRPHFQQAIERNSPNYPNILQTELRIIELNRRLQGRPISRHPTSPLPSNSYDEIWWERFASEFFEDDAKLTIRFQDDKLIEYTIGRTLIPRYFKSYFDGGVTEMSINLRNSREIRTNQVVILDCDHANIITKNFLKHPKVSLSPRVVVCTEGQLSLEFVPSSQDSLLIKAWKFNVRLCHEYIDRSITSMGLPNNLLVEPTTHLGIPHSTMVYLRMCSILEPMQELMIQHKFTNLEPKLCLKKLLFEKFKFKVDDECKKQNGRRKRKTIPSTVDEETNSVTIKKTKASAPVLCNTDNVSLPKAATLPNLDILIVGEPSCMAIDYRDDNERSIVEVENSNYQSENEISSKFNPSPENQVEEKIEQPIGIKQEEGQEKEQQKEEEKEEEKEEKNINEKTMVNDRQEENINNQRDQSAQEIPEDVVEIESKDDNGLQKVDVPDEKHQALLEEPVREISEEPVEKENNSTLALNDETQMNSTATQSENHYNIMNSIPEDREDTCRSILCDSIVSKLPPSSNNKSALTSNGSSNKQNRRRSSERKETLREGLMRTSDFVVAMKDLKSEQPSLWRITTGNNLLQQFEPKTQNGAILYENTNQYAGWNPEIKKDYVGVDVKLTQHTRNQITVERLLLNFQNLEDPDAFYDKHFVIYLQILISTALDPKFWESIENEPKHHDYFLTSHRIIEDITKRFKTKLANKLKLNETTLKNVEKYPNLSIKPVEKEERDQVCRACNTNPSTQVVSFGNRSYDLHSYKTVKVTSELSKTDDKDLKSNLCVACLELVKLYSEVHHMSYKLFNIARDKVELHRAKGKPINAVLDECLKDEDWLASVYAERDSLWSKIEPIQ